MQKTKKKIKKGLIFQVGVAYCGRREGSVFKVYYNYRQACRGKNPVGVFNRKDAAVIMAVLKCYKGPTGSNIIRVGRRSNRFNLSTVSADGIKVGCTYLRDYDIIRLARELGE